MSAEARMSPICAPPPNPALMAAMQEKRRSSATSPHANKARYSRTRAKQAIRREAEEQ